MAESTSVGGLNVLDFVTEDLHAPGIRRFVELLDHPQVDVPPLLEGLVQLDLADLATQRGLGELGDGEEVVANAVGRSCRVHDLKVENAVHPHLDVVRGDADLLLDIQGAAP